MIELNLPPYPYKVKQEKDKILIFDELRRRYVTLTPEEWVRQHFVAYLVNQKEFPRGLIGNEISLTLNKCNRRCDTIVYDRNGNPLCIAEYKAPHVEITQKTFDQIVRYNLVLQVSYLFVSNGIKHYCCHIIPPIAIHFYPIFLCIRIYSHAYVLCSRQFLRTSI